MAAAPAPPHPGSQSAQKRCVFVGNIPYDATEEQLIQICEEVGPVVSFRLVLDKETGKPKGYGFCEYKDDETALSARRNLQGYEINGRQLRVDFAENGKNADRNREQVEDPQFLTIEEAFYSPLKSSVQLKSCTLLIPMNENSGIFSPITASCFSSSHRDVMCMYNYLNCTYTCMLCVLIHLVVVLHSFELVHHVLLSQSKSVLAVSFRSFCEIMRQHRLLNKGVLGLKEFYQKCGEKFQVSTKSKQVLYKGRGGPGMAPSIEAQKQLAGTSILGDSNLHQPVGLPSAIHAASVMAGALGGSQTATVQNGLPVQYGLGNDPLTHYLSRMSRQQLYEIMSELKSLTTQNKELAKLLLEGIPQLPKALFQAQIMLGMVTPQMMQMAKSQQPSSSLAQSSPLVQSFPHPEGVMPMLPRPPVSLPASIPQNPTVLQEAGMPLQHVPPYQHPSQPQPRMFQHGHPAAATYPVVPSQPIGGPSILPSQPPAASRGLISQVQPPFLPQHLRPPVGPSGLTHPHLPQASSTNGPLPLAAVEPLPKEARLPGQAGIPSHLPELGHASKLRKLEDGKSVPGMINNSSPIYSTQSQTVVSGGPSGSQNASAVPLQQPEKEMPQLTPEVESALLQQVLQLTPEQLSSLPVEQQQQVIQLQKMLSAGK